jgi:hypothetical protein
MLLNIPPSDVMLHVSVVMLHANGRIGGGGDGFGFMPAVMATAVITINAATVLEKMPMMVVLPNPVAADTIPTTPRLFLSTHMLSFS